MTATPKFCDSIDTTAMVYLDDELASEEQRDLELHLLECESCRTHVDREREEITALRRKLRQTQPRIEIPAALLARLSQGFDAIDAELESASVPAIAIDLDAPIELHGNRVRRLWLPVTAVFAAAAAMLVFVVMPPADTSSQPSDTVAHEAVRQQLRGAPLEVQGASTAPWLARNFQPGVELPSFADDEIRLVGARLTALGGQPAAQLFYELSRGGARYRLVAFVVDGVNPGQLTAGTPVVVGGRVLRQVDAYGASAISYVDPNQRGYVFTSSELGGAELRNVVLGSNLIHDANVRVK